MTDSVLAFLRLALALPLVLLLCVVVLKYLVPRTLSGFAGGRRMRLVEQLSLGPKTGMSLVRVGGRYYLLAYHEGAVTVVREMDEPPEVLEVESLPAAKPLGGAVETAVERFLGRRFGRAFPRSRNRTGEGSDG